MGHSYKLLDYIFLFLENSFSIFCGPGRTLNRLLLMESGLLFQKECGKILHLFSSKIFYENIRGFIVLIQRRVVARKGE